MGTKSANKPERETERLAIRRKDGKIWSHLGQKWVEETPEELVRQEYLLSLVEQYGFQPSQMQEDVEVFGVGSDRGHADFVIWRSQEAKSERESPLIVVQCKSDNGAIDPEGYTEGRAYARLTNARFLVTHNNRETRFWRLPQSFEEIGDIPHAGASDREIDEIFGSLKVFKENQFADLLHECHNVIRNREKKDPAAAFDEIAKILFVKVSTERRMRAGRSRKNLFTAEFLDDQRQLHDDPINVLFKQTKADYQADLIFDPDEQINLKFNTAREIVRLLEQYNLSDTSEDIKGIAFERFLGKTFRGEIGQFFTPRTIVEFMIRMVDPVEGDIVCDPASGSGGFLIRFFQIVREQILADVDKQYQEYKDELDTKRTPDRKRAELLRDRFAELQETIRPEKKGSRLWTLANRCIYGTDANDRMARTSKMNMIMHGDGHGGVHHHDGFLNVNGIFEGRFSVVLTNPPFGASVESSDVILEGDVNVPEDAYRRYSEAYGKLYKDAQARVERAIGKSLLTLFELPKSEGSKVRTEILFLERCLSLLKPGGRLGIVLPEGVFNNPSLAYVREFCEDRAIVRAVVSIPQESFLSSGASVKVSLLFLQKFTEEQKADYDSKRAKAVEVVEDKYAPEISETTERLEGDIDRARRSKSSDRRKELQKELRDYLARMEATKRTEARAILKKQFSYPMFLYDAQHVGISATGNPDTNELYPNPRQPPGFEKTCLELYREFLLNPEAFLVESF